MSSGITIMIIDDLLSIIITIDNDNRSASQAHQNVGDIQFITSDNAVHNNNWLSENRILTSAMSNLCT